MGGGQPGHGPTQSPERGPSCLLPPKTPKNLLFLLFIFFFESEFGSILKNSGLNPWSFEFWRLPRLEPRAKLHPPPLNRRLDRAGEMIPEVEGTRPWGPSRKRVPKYIKGPKTTYTTIAVAEKLSKRSKKGPFSLYMGSFPVPPRRWNYWGPEGKVLPGPHRFLQPCGWIHQWRYLSYYFTNKKDIFRYY